MSGIPGTRPSSSPPITSGIGYGTRSQLATAFRPAAETKSAAMTICRLLTNSILRHPRAPWRYCPATASATGSSSSPDPGLVSDARPSVDLRRVADVAGVVDRPDRDVALVRRQPVRLDRPAPLGLGWAREWRRRSEPLGGDRLARGNDPVPVGSPAPIVAPRCLPA